MTWAIVAGIGMALGIIALWLLLVWAASVAQERRVRRRVTTDILRASEAEDAEQPWFHLFAEPGKKMDAWFDEQGETERLLVQAGWRSGVERTAYFAAQALLPIGALGLVLLAALTGRLGGGAGFVYGLLALIIALLAPRYFLRSRANRRRSRVRNEVPMFIHLLAMLFDAGLSTRQALSSLVRDGSQVLPALGAELRHVLRQLEAGAEPADTLLAMGRSLDVGELTAVLGVLRQVDRYGGELREPLMEALDVVEERRHLSLREKVNALSGRMTVVMVMFFFPALLIFVAGPAFLSVVRALGTD